MGISRDHTVKIKPHPGATSVEISDYIKLELRHQLDVIILHCGRNDISNEINTVNKLKKLLKEIEGYDIHNDIRHTTYDIRHTQKASSCYV